MIMNKVNSSYFKPPSLEMFVTQQWMTGWFSDDPFGYSVQVHYRGTRTLVADPECGRGSGGKWMD